MGPWRTSSTARPADLRSAYVAPRWTARHATVASTTARGTGASSTPGRSAAPGPHLRLLGCSSQRSGNSRQHNGIRSGDHSSCSPATCLPIDDLPWGPVCFRRTEQMVQIVATQCGVSDRHAILTACHAALSQLSLTLPLELRGRRWNDELIKHLFAR